MAGTRSSTKRKADETSSLSSTDKATKQTKIDDVLQPAEEKESAEKVEPKTKETESKAEEAEIKAEEAKPKSNGHAEKPEAVAKEETETKGQNGQTPHDNAKEDTSADTATVEGAAIEEDKEREKAQPSNILEKGIIYFFTRGRVGVDDPNSVQDLARSYFVLRPLPAGGKITDGAVQDAGNNRLLALPKKVWPKSGQDRFMVFVEKAKVSMDTLREEFFSGSEYSTKTTGVRQSPAVTPVGEGVYAITSTGSGRPTTHLAYMLTIPHEVGEVQKDIGLAERGSFVISLKNPQSSGPAYAQLPEGPGFPQEFIDEFSGRSWMPPEPKHLEYPNSQILLIGENFDSSSNLDQAPQDEKKEEKETPQEELEKLEEEDEHRVENLKGDDSVFADLGLSSKDYPKVMTTW